MIPCSLRIQISLRGPICGWAAGGDEDLEKAIQQAQREKDTKAWKILIQARTVRNNVAKVREG